MAYYIPVGDYEECCINPFFRYSNVFENIDCRIPRPLLDNEEEDRIEKDSMRYQYELNTSYWGHDDYEGMNRDAFENDSGAEWGIRD